MDTAHKADPAAFTIRAAEPQDAEAIAALIGAPGTFEGTLLGRRSRPRGSNSCSASSPATASS